MAKRTRKTHFLLEEVIEQCTRRDSDESEDAISDEESDISSIDSVAEEMFLDGGDMTLDKPSSENESDEVWEPGSKKQLTEGQSESTSSGEEPHPPPSQRRSASKTPRGRARGRGRGRGRSGSSQVEMSSSTSEDGWNDVDIPDLTPPQPTFRPTNAPGPQLIRTGTYTVLQFFQLFFSNTLLQTIITNTNDFGSTHYSKPSNPWIDITLQDIFAFIAMVIYMGIVKLPSITDFWRGGNLYSLPFPKKVMTGKKFLRICRSLHLSKMVDDAANEQRRGTPQFDRLCKIKPLYTEMRDACKRNFHPGQEISIDERMVASKARIGLKQYMKNKPVRWGYKLFVLADSNNGYTWDFFVYEGKLQGNSGKGLSYESVMELLDTQLLGTGYKLFVDNFYTSPSLFSDLLLKRIWACGTIRPNRIGFPKTQTNVLDSKSPRGSIRWIRKDSLLFVQWRDTRDVFMCSTLHTAQCGGHGSTESPRSRWALGVEGHLDSTSSEGVQPVHGWSGPI
ncbi:piggyBac transposable element-derived protein 4-like [Pimephales promelas]|uniref:piggyBac transposable element-derived protein 4-like n=1 Tax=Pimephales promelas TaxID=90988 RepID=UPI00195585F4|nr:piggyBac transposable element-derived protein 4-like [Pimephales promelas]